MDALLYTSRKLRRLVFRIIIVSVVTIGLHFYFSKVAEDDDISSSNGIFPNAEQKVFVHDKIPVEYQQEQKEDVQAVVQIQDWLDDNANVQDLSAFADKLPDGSPKFKVRNCIDSKCFIIHQTWKDYNIPVINKEYIKSCLQLNSNYEYWFWTDDDNRRLIEKYHFELLDVYDYMVNSVGRSDIARILYLKIFGGVYIDLDVECYLPLHPLLSSSDCIFSQVSLRHALVTELPFPLVSNFYISCKKAHPFLSMIIQVYKAITEVVDEKDVISVTGPLAITKLYNENQKLHPSMMPNIYNHSVFGHKTRFNRKFADLCKSEDKISKLSQMKNVKVELIVKECSHPSSIRASSESYMYIDHHYSNIWAKNREIITKNWIFLPNLVAEVFLLLKE